MGPVRVAIVGVGNCASSLVQGVEYYKNADPSATVPGLMHVQFGPYHVNDVKFVAAFDVDDKKVGKDLSEAINASENNTIKICDVPTLGVEVQRGHTLDGLGKYYRLTIDESAAEPVDIVMLTHNRLEHLERTIDALEQRTRAGRPAGGAIGALPAERRAGGSGGEDACLEQGFGPGGAGCALRAEPGGQRLRLSGPGGLAARGETGEAPDEALGLVAVDGAHAEPAHDRRREDGGEEDGGDDPRRDAVEGGRGIGPGRSRGLVVLGQGSGHRASRGGVPGVYRPGFAGT